MERLVLIIEQVEEAKRFIQIDDIAHLRMALLLLDNASEVLMYRAVGDELDRDDFYIKIFSFIRDRVHDEKFQEVKEQLKIEYELIPPKTRKALKKFYNAKVDFLTERGALESVIGQLLKSLHHYRNEAYHRDFLRKGTIRPAVQLLFEIVCDLLLILPPGMISHGGEDDWSAFCQRYGLDSTFNITQGGLEKIVERLKEPNIMPSRDLAKMLSAHLENRVSEMEELLQVIHRDAPGAATIEEELKRIQFVNEPGWVPPSKDNGESFGRYVAHYSLDDFSRWRQAASDILKGESKLAIFNKFIELELEIEPIENMVNEYANLVEQAIQAEVDRLRGK